MASASSLLSLPDVCWDRVLRCADLESLYALSRCCKQTQEKVNSLLRVLWTHLQNRPPGSLPPGGGPPGGLPLSGNFIDTLVFSRLRIERILAAHPQAHNHCVLLFIKLFREINEDTQPIREAMDPPIDNWFSANTPPTLQLLESVARRMQEQCAHIALEAQTEASWARAWRIPYDHRVRIEYIQKAAEGRLPPHTLIPFLNLLQDSVDGSISLQLLGTACTWGSFSLSTLSTIRVLLMHNPITEEDRNSIVHSLVENHRDDTKQRRLDATRRQEAPKTLRTRMKPMPPQECICLLHVLVTNGPISEIARDEAMRWIFSDLLYPIHDQDGRRKIRISQTQYAVFRHLCQQGPLSPDLRKAMLDTWRLLYHSPFALEILQLLLDRPSDPGTDACLPCTQNTREQAVISAAAAAEDPSHIFPIIQLLLPPTTPIATRSLERVIIHAIEHLSPETLEFLMLTYRSQISPRFRGYALEQAVLQCHHRDTARYPERVDKCMSMIHFLLKTGPSSYRAIQHAMDCVHLLPDVFELLFNHDVILDEDQDPDDSSPEYDYNSLFLHAIGHCCAGNDQPNLAGMPTRVLTRMRDLGLHISDKTLNAACLDATRLRNAPIIIRFLLAQADGNSISEETSDKIINATSMRHTGTMLAILDVFFQYHVPISSQAQEYLQTLVFDGIHGTDTADHPIALRLHAQLRAYLHRKEKISRNPCTIL